MRLFEVAGNQFQDDLAGVLHILQGRANNPGNGQPATQSVIPWAAINNMLSAKGYATVNADMVGKIKDKIDPNGTLIQNIDPVKGIILNTDVASPDDETPIGGKPQSKTVDQMAHSVVSKEF